MTGQRETGQIKVGSRVLYRGSWGSKLPKEATVTAIEETEEPGEKSGCPREQIAFSRRECSCIDLDDGHWCYGDQIDAVLD